MHEPIQEDNGRDHGGDEAQILTRKVIRRGVVLRIVAELLGGGGIAKEEGEGGEDVLARRRKGGRGGEVLGHIGFGGHDERLKKRCLRQQIVYIHMTSEVDKNAEG